MGGAGTHALMVQARGSNLPKHKSGALEIVL
jgi:hypothetical protein